MGRELRGYFPVGARSVFDEADRALGFSISELVLLAAPRKHLKLTENTQPAILTVSVAAYRVLEEKGVRPDFVAGHSLGEYSALVAAGALTFADAVRLVRSAGNTCRRRFRRAKAPWPRFWACARPSGGDLPQGRRRPVVAPANLNSPEQTVISGHAAAVKRAVEQASASGAKRAVMLAVSAPFHSELMRRAGTPGKGSARHRISRLCAFRWSPMSDAASSPTAMKRAKR